MRQNLPQTLPNTFQNFFGVIFHPKVPQKGYVLKPPLQSTRHPLALQNCQNRHGTISCGPKTRLWGSLRATKCLDASDSVPRRHTISMGLYLGVPRAPWVRQNRKNREFHPFRGPRKKHKSKTPQNPQKVKKSKFCKNEAVSSIFFCLRYGQSTQANQ